jgi:ElaA protein
MTAPSGSEPTVIAWHWAAFDELTPRQLYDIIRARIDVFVIEQQCAYQDCDGVDLVAHHLWATDPDGQVGAYLRVVPPGVKYAEPSIGRVITSRSVRGTGMGRALIAEGVRRTEALYPGLGIRIAAQRYLLRFYGDFGFVSTGYDFLEDNIPHTEMLRSAR